MEIRVRLDAEEFYRTQSDPWGIGDADSARYDRYVALLTEHARSRRSLLDIGSGFGAFAARFRDQFEILHAVEVSEIAVQAGRERFPFIDFEQGSAAELEATRVDGERFDAIIFSDVIYYLDDRGKRASLDWIATHLSREGIALIANYAPGGRYLTADELRAMLRPRFRILDEVSFTSHHVAFVVARRRRMVALTLDHETWQPLPDGKRIDWEEDVFAPTASLLDVCDEAGAPLTIFAEVGEYLWLAENEPGTAGRMAEQWRDAVRRGHEVQLHLHPQWLPELGARREGDRWIWDWSGANVDDYPGDICGLIARCKAAIEEAIRPVDPAYEVTCFRAGAYEAQPFRRLYEALARNRIKADSSVYAGGQRPDRHYDYSLAYSTHQPYFASRSDPQLRAPPAERAIVELPLFSSRPNTRWSFDGGGGGRFAEELLDHLRAVEADDHSVGARRRRARIRDLAGIAYARLRRARRLLHRIVPRRYLHALTAYLPERLVEDEYFVLIAHSKADLDFVGIRDGLGRLAAGVEFVGLSGMERVARADLDRSVNATAEAEASRQVQREASAVLGEQRNEAQSLRLQALIPYDRRRVLDLGCGAGQWSARIAGEHPWMDVVGVDVGPEFIAAARERFAAERVSFEVADFADLPFEDGTFDCVYADNSLEHAFDVDRTLAEAHRLLGEGGVLVAAIPSDARNPRQACDNHTWKTAPHDVRERLRAVGFVDVKIHEIDVVKELGAPPFPPARDRMMYVTAWKRIKPVTRRGRAEEIATFAYRALEPDRPHDAGTLEEILAGGAAWCAGYAVATGLLLERASFRVHWATLLPDRLPPTQGPAEVDAHEVLEVEFSEGWLVLDPMANVWYEHSLAELLAQPELAAVEAHADRRFIERSYEEYAGPGLYASTREVAIRTGLREAQLFVPVDTFIRGASNERLDAARRRLGFYVAAARARLRRATGRGTA